MAGFVVKSVEEMIVIIIPAKMKVVILIVKATAMTKVMKKVRIMDKINHNYYFINKPAYK